MEYWARSNAGPAQPEIEEEKSFKPQASSLKKATIKKQDKFLT